MIIHVTNFLSCVTAPSILGNGLEQGEGVSSSTNLDDIETHVDDVLGAGAVIPGPRVTLEGVAQVTLVQVVVTEVIMASPVAEREQKLSMQDIHVDGSTQSVFQEQHTCM